GNVQLCWDTIRFPTCQGTPLVEWCMCAITLIPLLRSPLMIHTMPTKALLATTLRPLVVQLSSSLAHGARLIDHFLHQEPTPQKMATFDRERSTLLQDVGRRIIAWVLNHMEPEHPEEMPARLWWKGRAYRRRRKHRTTIATLFGPVDVWRRLYEPLVSGSRSIHPLELRLGIE